MVCLRQLGLGGILLLALGSRVWSQTTCNGCDLALRSTGTSAGTAWTLDRNGYVGTYIHLDNPGDVTIDVQAEGTSYAGVDPNMNIVIADNKVGFDVAPGVGTYSHTYFLPAGTFFVRTEFNNDLAVTPRQLRIDSLTVTGATISNATTDTNALASADTYIANYRQGNASVGAFAPGEQVRVSLKRIAFNWGAGVHGNIDQLLGSGGTTEQENYQKYLNQNFNTIVTAGPGYWLYDEPTQGQVDISDATRLINYAQAHAMRTRFHNDIWQYTQPTWVNSLITSAGNGSSRAKTQLAAAIATRANYLFGSPSLPWDEIDVYNEMPTITAKNSYLSIFGTGGVAAIYDNVRKVASATGYSPKLFVNDGNVLENTDYAKNYIQSLESILSAGQAAGLGSVVSGMGIEDYSTGLGAAPPAQFMKELQATNVEGIPSELTEFGVKSGVSASDAATILNQAMRLMFGNPNSIGFVNWDWTLEDNGQNGQYAPYNGLYTVSTTGSNAWDNWTITPAGNTWQALLSQWTTQLTVTADANGRINFNGYYGDYVLTADGRTYNFSLVKGTSH